MVGDETVFTLLLVALAVRNDRKEPFYAVCCVNCFLTKQVASFG